jgi:hypothetical protein
MYLNIDHSRCINSGFIAESLSLYRENHPVENLDSSVELLTSSKQSIVRFNGRRNVDFKRVK